MRTTRATVWSRAKRAVTATVIALMAVGVAAGTAAAAPDDEILTIDKSVATSEIKPGGTVTFDVAVGCSSNTSLCEGAVSTDVVPAPLEVVSVVMDETYGTATTSGNTVNVAFTQTDEEGKVGLADGTSVVYQVVARVPSTLGFWDWHGTEVVNTASAQGTFAPRVSDDATVQIAVNPPPLRAGITKTATSLNVASGQSTTVTLVGSVLGNATNDHARTLTVGDMAGNWWNYFSLSGITSITLPPDTTGEVTYRYVGGATSTHAYDGVTIPAPNAGGDVNGFTVTATSTDAPATRQTGIAPSETITVVFGAVARPGMSAYSVTNLATVTATPANGTVPVTATDTETFRAGSTADLRITKTFEPATVTVGNSNGFALNANATWAPGSTPTAVTVNDTATTFFDAPKRLNAIIVTTDPQAALTYEVRVLSDASAWSTVATFTGPSGSAQTWVPAGGVLSRGFEIIATPLPTNTDLTWDFTVRASLVAATVGTTTNTATLCPPGVGPAQCATASADLTVTPNGGPQIPPITGSKSGTPASFVRTAPPTLTYNVVSGGSPTEYRPTGQTYGTLTDNTGTVWDYYRLDTIQSISMAEAFAGNTALSGVTLETYNRATGTWTPVDSWTGATLNLPTYNRTITAANGQDGLRVPRDGVTIPASVTQITNTADLDFDHSPGGVRTPLGHLDLDSRNNVTTPPTPAPSLTKTAASPGNAVISGVPFVAPGDHVDWTITLRNGGTSASALTNPVLTDTLPGAQGRPLLTQDGTPTVTLAGAAVDPSLVSITWGPVQPDGSRTFTVAYTGQIRGGQSLVVVIPTKTSTTYAGSITNSVNATFDVNGVSTTQPPVTATAQNAGTVGIDAAKTVREVPTGGAPLTGVIDIVDGTSGSASADTFYRYPDLVRTLPGGQAQWRLETTNTGTTALSDLITVDVLPQAGNGGVIVGGNLDSTWAPVLDGPVTVEGPGTHTVRYLIGASTCTVAQGVVATSDACSWQTLPAGFTDWATVTGFRVDSDFGTSGLTLGESVVATVTTLNPDRLPDGASEIENAASWNTFASARRPASGLLDAVLLSEQPRKAGITMANPADGTFTITKDVVGDYAPSEDDTFTVDYTYDDGAGFSGTGTMTLVNGVATASQPLRPGTVVTFTEQTPAPIAGFTWSAPAFAPTSVTIAEGTTTPVTLTNTITANPPGKVSVGDHVWFDANGDGRQDSTDEPIEGVTLTLTGPDGGEVTDVDGNVVAPTVTDADGWYEFAGLPVLTDGQAYTVTVTTPTGYVPTTSNVGDREGDSDNPSATSQGLTVDGEHDPTLDFGFVREVVAPGCVSVGDYVWFDTNGNGRQDPGEPGIEGVTLTLTGPDGQPVIGVDGNPVAPTTTDANGAYLFACLPILNDGESYTVTVTTPVGYVPTTSSVGDREGDSDSPSATSEGLTSDGEHDPTLDFGFVREVVVPGKVTVGDYVWVDENDNGLQDAGEPGIPGVVLILTGPDGQPVTDVNGNPVDPATTDENGHYLFPNLPVLPTCEEGYTVTIDRDASAEALVGYLPAKDSQGEDRGTDSSTWTVTSHLCLTEDGAEDLTLDFGFVKKVEPTEPTTPGEPTTPPTEPVTPTEPTTPVEAVTTVTPTQGATARPEGELEATGAGVAGAALTAAVLAAAGIALLAARRRREASEI